MNQEQRLNDLFDKAKQLPTAYSFEEIKAQFAEAANGNATKTTKSNPTVVSLKTIVIMLSITSISLVAIWLSFKPAEQAPQTKTSPILTKQNNDENQLPKNTISPTLTPTRKLSSSSLIVLPTMLEEVPEAPNAAVLPPVDEQVASFIPELYRAKPIDEYQFPKLTQEEIKANYKRKKKMLRAIEKRDDKMYAYVPSGTFQYDSKQVSVQAFYMGVSEVSNVEYRTFLFDLLINDRKDEFLKAKPDQTQWVVQYNTWENAAKFQEHYFSHPAFDDFPVVNVSREGAEMYCKWLTAELLKTVDEDKQKKINDVRLPNRVEWVKAASNEGQQLPYPWDGRFLRDYRGLIMANFTPVATDSIHGNPDAGDDGADLIASTKSYFPNARGLFNMAGNVAELVYEPRLPAPMYKSKEEGEAAAKDLPPQEIGTAGGSWRSSGEEIKILAPDPFKGKVTAHPTIGFRVVFTWLSH